jgi:hypothetical protein
VIDPAAVNTAAGSIFFKREWRPVRRARGSTRPVCSWKWRGREARRRELSGRWRRSGRRGAWRLCRRRRFCRGRGGGTGGPRAVGALLGGACTPARRLVVPRNGTSRPLDPDHVPLRESKRFAGSLDDHPIAFFGDLRPPDSLSVLQVHGIRVCFRRQNEDRCDGDGPHRFHPSPPLNPDILPVALHWFHIRRPHFRCRGLRRQGSFPPARTRRPRETDALTFACGHATDRPAQAAEEDPSAGTHPPDGCPACSGAPCGVPGFGMCAENPSRVPVRCKGSRRRGDP